MRLLSQRVKYPRDFFKISVYRSRAPRRVNYSRIVNDRATFSYDYREIEITVAIWRMDTCRRREVNLRLSGREQGGSIVQALARLA
jgi:hypothetical protein